MNVDAMVIITSSVQWCLNLTCPIVDESIRMHITGLEGDRLAKFHKMKGRYVRYACEIQKFLT